MSQARLVFWDESSMSKGYGFRLVNASSEPLVDAVVRLTVPKDSKISPSGSVSFALGGVPPTGLEGKAIHAVAQQMNAVSKDLDSKPMSSIPRAWYGPHAFWIDLVFKDAGGREWHRADDMSLTEVMPGKSPHFDSYEERYRRRTSSQHAAGDSVGQ